MKRILVPTDFSTPAEAAFRFAIELANGFGSEVTLLYLYQVHSTTGMFISVESYMKENAAGHMLKLVREAEGHLTPPARIESRIIRAETAPAIVEQAERGGYDLVVMGAQGATGARDVFLGSTTTGVLRRIRKPVLAVPAGFAFRSPHTIVLAMDEGGISHAGILAPLLQLCRRFGARVQVYHKDSGKADGGVDPAVEIFLDDIEHSYHYELDTDKLNVSINDFVNETNADLLCMIRRQRGFLQNLFHISATSRGIFHTSVPLLVLHDVE